MYHSSINTVSIYPALSWGTVLLIPYLLKFKYPYWCLVLTEKLEFISLHQRQFWKNSVPFNENVASSEKRIFHVINGYLLTLLEYHNRIQSVCLFLWMQPIKICASSRSDSNLSPTINLIKIFHPYSMLLAFLLILKTNTS